MGEEASTDRKNGPGVQLQFASFWHLWSFNRGLPDFTSDADLDNEDRLAV